MPFLKASDIISGQEGKITFNVKGNLETGAWVKQFEATCEKQKSEIHTLGHRGTQHKTTGWSGTGTMTIWYITSLFRQLAAEYAATGKDTYFDMTVENNDPTSTVGKQTACFYGVNIDSTTIAKLDVDNTELDEDLDFTFDDFVILDAFGQPVLGG